MSHAALAKWTARTEKQSTTSSNRSTPDASVGAPLFTGCPQPWRTELRKRGGGARAKPPHMHRTLPEEGNAPAPRQPALRTKRTESGKGPICMSGQPESLDTHQNPEAQRDRPRSSHNQENKQHKTRSTKPGEKAMLTDSPVGKDNDSIFGFNAVNDVVDSKDDDLAPEGEVTVMVKAADWRNQDQVERANASDQKLVSKYLLPMTVVEFLPSKIPGPNDAFRPLAWLMEAVKSVSTTDALVPKAPPVMINLSEEAVGFNTDLLKDNNPSLQQLLSQHQDTTLGFGSTFCPLLVPSCSQQKKPTPEPCLWRYRSQRP
jgi:hypothetical protein